MPVLSKIRPVKCWDFANRRRFPVRFPRFTVIVPDFQRNNPQGGDYHQLNMSKKEDQAGAAVVTVGDELVLGERGNENAQWLANWLHDQGHPANVALSLPDDIAVIAHWLQQLKGSSHFPICVSGGIGGTHDDCTREGIAAALGVQVVTHPDCWALLAERYGGEFNESRQNMTMLPEGCELLKNPHGAPGFHHSGIFAFPGFPKMLKAMVPQILPLFGRVQAAIPTKRAEVRLEAREGDLAGAVRQFDENYPQARLGIYAHSGTHWGQVSLRLRYPESDSEILGAFQELVQYLGKPVLTAEGVSVD